LGKLEAVGLIKKYGRSEVVSEINITVNTGEVVGLLGKVEENLHDTDQLLKIKDYAVARFAVIAKIEMPQALLLINDTLKQSRKISIRTVSWPCLGGVFL
jgi:hypothetical protein